MFGLFIDEAISDRGTKEYMCRSPTMLRDPKTNPLVPFVIIFMVVFVILDMTTAVLYDGRDAPQ